MQGKAGCLPLLAGRTEVAAEDGVETGTSPRARVLGAPQESNLPLWGGGEPGVGNFMKRLPTLVPTQENQRGGCEGGAARAPSSRCTSGLIPAALVESMAVAEGVAAARPHQPTGLGERRSEGARPGKTPCWPSLAQVS